MRASLIKMKTGSKRLVADEEDESLFDTVVKTYKKYCSQTRAEKFSAPKSIDKKRTADNKKEMFGVSFYPDCWYVKTTHWNNVYRIH